MIAHIARDDMISFHGTYSFWNGVKMDLCHELSLIIDDTVTKGAEKMVLVATKTQIGT